MQRRSSYGTRFDGTMKKGAPDAYVGDGKDWALMLSSLKSILDKGKALTTA
jgi:hypothetical protein